MERLDVEHWLSGLANALIFETTARGAIKEGVVSGSGPRPYRRLDCDGRALAYIRERPKKRSVRVDVSGLWSVPSASRLLIHGASGAASLLVRSASDVEEAARYLWETVDRTRRARALAVATDRGNQNPSSTSDLDCDRARALAVATDRGEPNPSSTSDLDRDRARHDTSLSR